MGRTFESPSVVEAKKRREEWLAFEKARRKKCGCGCGKLIPVCERYYYRKGGVPDFLPGHYNKLNPPCNQVPRTLEQRTKDFWARVDERGLDECWEWKKECVGGYGCFNLNGKNVGAHRMSYFLHRGRWPKGFTCHTCDNPKCVNPRHLFDGTQRDNMHDAAVKLRSVRKLTPETVKRLVRLVKSGKTRKEAARILGMSHASAVKIMAGEVWGHVTGIKWEGRKRKNVKRN